MGELDLYTYHRNKGEKISALHIAEQKQGLICMQPVVVSLKAAP